MKWFLLIVIILWGFAWWAWHASDRPGDDFGTAFVTIVFVVAAFIATVIYIALGFWNHAFL